MERVEYTPRIRPLCLWMGKPDLESVVGRSGYVVGWRRDQQNRRQSAEPRMSKVPIVSQVNVNFCHKNRTRRAIFQVKKKNIRYFFRKTVLEVTLHLSTQRRTGRFALVEEMVVAVLVLAIAVVDS